MGFTRLVISILCRHRTAQFWFISGSKDIYQMHLLQRLHKNNCRDRVFQIETVTRHYQLPPM